MSDLVPFSCSGRQVRTVQVAYEPSTVREAVLLVGGDTIIKGLESHLYVVEYVDFGVKVGITERPESRFADHVRAAKSHKRPIGRVWLSQPHVKARENESLLIASCRSFVGITDKKRREYFQVGFDRVVPEAEALLFQRGNREEFERRVTATTDLFKSLVLNGPGGAA